MWILFTTVNEGVLSIRDLSSSYCTPRDKCNIEAMIKEWWGCSYHGGNNGKMKGTCGIERSMG